MGSLIRPTYPGIVIKNKNFPVECEEGTYLLDLGEGYATIYQYSKGKYRLFPHQECDYFFIGQHGVLVAVQGDKYVAYPSEKVYLEEFFSCLLDLQGLLLSRPTVGPEGPTGPTGLTGLQGSVGPTGPSGSVGTTVSVGLPIFFDSIIPPRVDRIGNQVDAANGALIPFTTSDTIFVDPSGNLLINGQVQFQNTYQLPLVEGVTTTLFALNGNTITIPPGDYRITTEFAILLNDVIGFTVSGNTYSAIITPATAATFLSVSLVGANINPSPASYDMTLDYNAGSRYLNYQQIFYSNSITPVTFFVALTFSFDSINNITPEGFLPPAPGLTGVYASPFGIIEASRLFIAQSG